MIRFTALFSLTLLACTSFAQSSPSTAALERNGATVTIEPYAPNIVRVTLSTIAREAQAAPGYGFVAHADGTDWTHAINSEGADIYTSARMLVTVAPEHRRRPGGKLPDTAKFFSGAGGGVDIAFTLPDGTPLTEMDGWSMAALNQKDDTLRNARGIKPEDLPLYTVSRVSFFVIAGHTPNEIYAGYRLLTGSAPMLPKAAYGFIQCKQRYSSQAEVLAVAKGYRERHLPLDMIVVDWFYYTKMGQYDFKPEDWPDPAAMNSQLHAQNIESMISV